MHSKTKRIIKATIMNIIVALLFALLLFGIIYLVAGNQIKMAISLVNLISIDTSKKEVVATTINTETKKIQNYPEYGSKYGTLEIEKIDVNLPIYFGDTLTILKNGVGHSSGSYFPGEGGSIVYMGHNYKTFFRRFNELEKGDSIHITTTYGKYQYKIYDIKIIEETDLDAIPIQKEKEILMVYTCYPLNNIGYAHQRMVVYADLVE